MVRWMGATGAAMFLLLLLGVLFHSPAGGDAAVGEPGAHGALPAGVDAAMVERGRYLTAIIGCDDCHTPLIMGPNGPERDMSMSLAGHPQNLAMPPVEPGEGPWNMLMAASMTAFTGPWGVSYAPNLTPDRQTGMGAWTEAMFVTAMRSGRHMGVSRPIMPPMPWPAYGRMTDDDLRAIFAYLQSIPPIENQVPPSMTWDELREAADTGYSQ